MLTIPELFSKVRESHIRAGSHRLQRLLGPQYFHALSFAPIILVGGTNGKGTTCAFLESIFRHSGLKTGLYTSPHLVHISERIRISGAPVPEKEILDTIEKIDTNRQTFLPDATFFELMTAAAIILFFEKKVDLVICEVGLGGRYDSTNALNPSVSVLTGVSLDHTHILGADVGTIARDKSYIARRNKPFVVNANLPKKARQAVVDTEKILGNEVVWTSQKLNTDLEKIFLEHLYHKAKTNLRTALTVVDAFMKNAKQLPCVLNAGSIRKGIEKTFWPGRFDVREIQNRTVIFDSAHNPGGIEFFLQQYKKSRFRNQKYSLLFSSLNDKDWKKNISLLLPYAESIEIVQLENERAQNAHSIGFYVKESFPHLRLYGQNFSEVTHCTCGRSIVTSSLMRPTSTRRDSFRATTSCTSCSSGKILSTQPSVNIENELKKSVLRTLNSSLDNPVLVIGSIAFVGAVFESLNINVFPSV